MPLSRKYTILTEFRILCLTILVNGCKMFHILVGGVQFLKSQMLIESSKIDKNNFALKVLALHI